MPYQSEDDPVVEALNSMVWSIIGLFAGVLAALGIFAWQKYTTPKLPESLCQDQNESPQNDQVENPQHKRSVR